MLKSVDLNIFKGTTMFDEIALMMVMMWPSIPIFLVELHFATNFWRRLGLWTYFVVILEWLPIAFAIYLWRETILYLQIALAIPFLFLGVGLVAAGIALHSWTAKLIGIKATIGYTELKPNDKSTQTNLVTSGPFSIVRHPSYWAHTSILTGLFLITGVVFLGIIAAIDLGITYFVTTTLEDKELVDRFKDQYKKYQKNVPKLFPKLSKTKRTSSN